MDLRFHDSTPFYAGRSLTMECFVLVDVSVDIPYRITYSWLRSGLTLNADDRIEISNVTQNRLYSYAATLMINPISKTTDTGTYTCSVVIHPNSTEIEVQGSSQSDTESIIIEGMQFRLPFIESCCSKTGATILNVFAI